MPKKIGARTAKTNDSRLVHGLGAQRAAPGGTRVPATNAPNTAWMPIALGGRGAQEGHDHHDDQIGVLRLKPLADQRTSQRSAGYRTTTAIAAMKPR